jgi:hypothetical protein
MKNTIIQKLIDKSITKEELYKKVKQNFSLLPTLIIGVSSPKAAIRYGCARVLINLSEEHPEKMYSYMNNFVELLDSKFRILKWTAMSIIANLTKVDTEKKFDVIFGKYFSYLNDEYMVTVANLVTHSGKIGLSKPYLIQKITNELLKVENISLSPHLTEECKRVIIEKTIKVFNQFFDKIENKEKVFTFVKKYVSSPRKTLKKESELFLNKWD